MGIIQAGKDGVTDLFEKVASPASRAGSTVERVGKMSEAGVDRDVIALQLSKNSPNGNTYTVAHVDAYSMLYQDAKTKVVITAAQATALIGDSKGDEPDFSLNPA